MFLLEFDACEGTAAKAARAALIAYLQREVADDAELVHAEAIFLELIANVCKHASRWARATITWRRDGAPVLMVTDYGPGFDLAQWHPLARLAEHGRGLMIVSALARDVYIHPGPEGCGTRVEAVLPCRRRLVAA